MGPGLEIEDIGDCGAMLCGDRGDCGPMCGDPKPDGEYWTLCGIVGSTID